MSKEEVCEMAGCERMASRITSTESKYVVICDTCWHEKYKK